MELTFVLVIMFGILSSRTSVILARGGAMSNNIIVAILGFLGMVALFAGIIWGFMNLSWYWPVIAFVLGNIAGAIFITRHNLPIWQIVQVPIDVVVVGTVLFWWVAV